MGYNKQNHQPIFLWDDEPQIPDFPKDGPIALIDADSLIYYEMGKNTLEEAMAGLDQRIIDILLKCKTPYYAGFLTIGKCFRYNIAKTRPYKYNRKGGSKPPIFYALKEYSKQKWNFTCIKGLEADDLVCVYKHMHSDSIICSPDKDVIYQCSGKHYNYNKATNILTKKIQAKKFLFKQVLMGDPGDGIPGLPKVGPKTAEKWIDNENPSELAEFVLKKYIEKFGLSNGIRIFTETFNLIYILKTPEEVLQSTGIEMPPLVINNINNIYEKS